MEELESINLLIYYLLSIKIKLHKLINKLILHFLQKKNWKEIKLIKTNYINIIKNNKFQSKVYIKQLMTLM